MQIGTTRTTGTTPMHTYIYGETYTPYAFTYKAKCENGCPSCPKVIQMLAYQALQPGQQHKIQSSIGQLELFRRPIC